jgi:hypothetical protein
LALQYAEKIDAPMFGIAMSAATGPDEEVSN